MVVVGGGGEGPKEGLGGGYVVGGWVGVAACQSGFGLDGGGLLGMLQPEQPFSD